MAKTLSEILTEITNKILTGGRRTTATNTRSVLTDLANSSLNIKDGGLVIEDQIGYNSELTPTDPKHLATKKYVDDNSGTVPNADETTAGKVFIASDAEVDAQLTTGTTLPSQDNNVISLRGLKMALNWVVSWVSANFINRISTNITLFADNAGSGNTFTCTGSPAFTNYPNLIILTFAQTAGYQPTGASTITIDGLTTVPLVRNDGTDLQPGDVIGGLRYTCTYTSVYGYRMVAVGVDSGGFFTQSSQAQAEAAASNTAVGTPTTLETTTGITPNRLWYFFQKAKEYILEAFGVLTFGSTVTWSAAKSFNQAKVTATGDFILTITDLKSGAQGYLKVITNTASAITITFTSTTYTFKQLNVVKTTHTLPAGTAKEYFINFQVDGTDVELYINDRDEPLLSGDVVSDNSGVTTLQDEVVKFQHIDPAENRDLVVSNATVQTALNTESGWSGDTKTGISDLLAGQIYEGNNLTTSVKYRYACVADGTATRVPVGQAQDITTLTTILQPLYQNYVDAGNVTTGETDLYTYTLPASGKGNLSNNGQEIDAYFGGIIVGHATATRRIRAYFGGTVIYDSTAVVYTANTDWYLKIDIVRVSSSVVRAIITYRNSTTSVLNTKYTEVTGLTLSNTQVFKITGQAASTGAATNDIVAKAASIKYLPQSV